MSDARKCDRCHQYYVMRSDAGRNSSTIIKSESVNGSHNSNTYDLCDACTSDFNEFMAAFPLEVESPGDTELGGEYYPDDILPEEPPKLEMPDNKDESTSGDVSDIIPETPNKVEPPVGE